MTKNTLTKENVMAKPRVLKVVINMGIGRLMNQSKNQKELLEDLVRLLGMLTGQKPQVVLSRKSIATFKLRKGMPIGLKVTLRGKRGEDFVTRLVNLVFPRVRDFRGVAESSVSENSLTVGFKEHIVFPEITNENAKAPFSLQVTIVSTTENKESAKAFFEALGVRFKK